MAERTTHEQVYASRVKRIAALFELLLHDKYHNLGNLIATYALEAYTPVWPQVCYRDEYYGTRSTRKHSRIEASSHTMMQMISDDNIAEMEINLEHIIFFRVRRSFICTANGLFMKPNVVYNSVAWRLPLPFGWPTPFEDLPEAVYRINSTGALFDFKRRNLPSIVFLRRPDPPETVVGVCVFCGVKVTTIKRCEYCHSQLYCNTSCQRLHWDQLHKSECVPAYINLYKSECDKGRNQKGQNDKQDPSGPMAFAKAIKHKHGPCHNANGHRQ
jgi:hypothetical protein